MATIDVDLPDDLAEQVKRRDLPVSAICQRALRAEISHRQPIEQAVGIIVQVGEPAIDIGFRGTLARRARPGQHPSRPRGGAYWGVALTKRSRIPVYRAHVNTAWPTSLADYDTLDNATADNLPEQIITKATEALSKANVIWRDI